MQAELRIWAADTPLTKRGGCYTDELLCVTIQAVDPQDAKKQLILLMSKTPHAALGHIDMPEWWNQNCRTTWVSMLDVHRFLRTQK